MKYASICSGIEAPTVAWHPLGWEPVWFAENAKFPSSVLAHHYPAVPNLGDATKITENEIYIDATFDLLVGGTPCQGFSTAGKRGGMDDPRSRLAWEYVRIAEQKRPTWILWENVPGVLSSESSGSRDFEAFVAALSGIGYGVCWRVLDAQYFGVAQRRKRVFLVGYIGDWRPAAAVLFEPHSLRRSAPPSRKKREDSTGNVAACAAKGGVQEVENAPGGNFIFQDIACTLKTSLSGAYCSNRDGMGNLIHNDIAGTLCANGKAAGSLTSQDVYQGNVVIERPVAAESGNRETTVGACLTASSGPRLDMETETFVVEGAQPSICINYTQQFAEGKGFIEESAHALACQHVHATQDKTGVRRLTPIEYERLQGFPDNYTKVPHNRKDASRCPDGPRYAACGNSIAVPVLNWIGRRIEMVDKLKQTT